MSEDGHLTTAEDIAVATLLVELRTLIEEIGEQMITTGVPPYRWIALEGFLLGTARTIRSMKTGRDHSA